MASAAQAEKSRKFGMSDTRDRGHGGRRSLCGSPQGRNRSSDSRGLSHPSYPTVTPTAHHESQQRHILAQRAVYARLEHKIVNRVLPLDGLLQHPADA
jgi:hypothetical protein